MQTEAAIHGRKNALIAARVRVHIRDRNDFFVGHSRKVFPTRLDLINRRHIRHRTTGAHIGSRTAPFDVRRTQDVRSSPP